ncbi:RNA polymerase sigma factor [Paenibacillus tepidiphilus]|uniref:RNA polymerase sigma factor n=1 Tax=Paenibacillus tepidiphilus TaxID=2608683 RepID=UPI001239C50C|nr:RNA polymerase sigma factor [Paenibacillus tepidiphilus]
MIIRHTYGDVYRFIRWKVHDSELAWDLAQSVYEKVWTRLDTYIGNQGSFRSWLMAIASNVCIDYYRSKAARQTKATEPGSVNMNEVAADSDFLEGILLREEVAAVYDVIRQLPKEQRDALLLRYKYEYSYKEIAAVLNEPETTVKSRVSRSLQKLRTTLSEKTTKREGKNKKGADERHVQRPSKPSVSGKA